MTYSMSAAATIGAKCGANYITPIEVASGHMRSPTLPCASFQWHPVTCIAPPNLTPIAAYWQADGGGVSFRGGLRARNFIHRNPHSVVIRRSATHRPSTSVSPSFASARRRFQADAFREHGCGIRCCRSRSASRVASLQQRTYQRKP